MDSAARVRRRTTRGDVPAPGGSDRTGPPYARSGRGDGTENHARYDRQQAFGAAMVDAEMETTVKPEILLLEQLLETSSPPDGCGCRASSGRSCGLRNRCSTCSTASRKAFPIGSIMVWDTDLELHSLDTIAGMSVPARPKRPVSYVLDGHQRLSTLFGALARRPARAEQDPWWIYRSLGVAGGAQYQHWIGTQPPPATVLPMQAILRTMDFLAFGRALLPRGRRRCRVRGTHRRGRQNGWPCASRATRWPSSGSSVATWRMPRVRLRGSTARDNTSPRTR